MALVLATIAEPSTGLNAPPDAEAMGIASQAIVNKTWAMAPPLWAEFSLKYDQSFTGKNWSNTTQIYNAAANYTAWVTSRITNLTEELHGSQPLRSLWTNLSRLKVPGFETMECLGDPSLASPLLLDTKLTLLYEKVGLANGNLSYLSSEAQNLSLPAKKALVFAFDCLSDVMTQVKASWGGLNSTQLHRLVDNHTKARNMSSTLQNQSAGNLSWLLDYYNLTARLHPHALANATSLLFDLSLKIQSYAKTANLSSGVALVPDVESFICVGSHGDDTWAADTCGLLTIDPGGNDRYDNGAAGASLPKTASEPKGCTPSARYCALSVVLDLGGNDWYEPDNLCEEPVIASGQAGVGMILDAAGTDHYVANIGVRTGIVGGAGVLLDLGQDIDHYNTTADPAYQCGLAPVPGNEYDADSGMLAKASLGGLALVFDEGGNDDIRTTGVDFAGSATLGSVALFLNNGTGSDTYRFKPGPYKGLRTGPGGGFGEAGAVGILLESGGDDTYVCEGPVNYGCMGGGHFGGMGLHLDLGGADFRAVYEPIAVTEGLDRTGFGRGAGAAQLAGIGLTFDAGGDDTYSGNYSIGYGACLGVGMLVDIAGDDNYSTQQGYSIGWGNPGSASCLVDIDPVGSGIHWDGGGTDTYVAPAPACGSRSDGKAWRDGPGTGQASSGIGIDEPATDIADCT